MKNLIGIGNSGEYFVAGELERRGFSVAIPMSNTPVFDILAVLKSNDDNDSCKQTYKQIIVQVKTINGNGNEWTMSAKDEKINAENPDIVVSAGDFVCGHTRHSTMPIEQIAKTLSKVKANYGFYTSLGNHDGWYGKDEITKNLEQNGIKVLSNSNVGVNVNGQKLYIAGIEDYDTGKPDIYKALDGIEVDKNGRYNKPVIMLSHTPDMFPKMPDEITLVLAGHCHGGQIRIPF